MEKLFSTKLNDKTTNLFLIEDSIEILDCDFYKDRNTLWVCDKNSLSYVVEGVNVVILPEGEAAKNLKSVEKIVKSAFKYNLGRDAHFIAVGGGVVCDVTAFAASIYMRSVDLSLVPTTLLAMVDASLGGKTAVDLLDIKNLVGSFYPAKNLFLNFHSLKTLDNRQYLNGLGEVLKHALLTKDDNLAKFLEENRTQILKRDTTLLKEVIIESLKVKKMFIESDPNETKGIREALNLGHTFAHALETTGNLTQFNHGEAVIWGTNKSLEASLKLNLVTKEFSQRYKELFQSYGYNLDFKVNDKNRFIEALKHDKKNRNSQIRFVLMKEQGEFLIKVLEEDFILSLI